MNVLVAVMVVQNLGLKESLFFGINELISNNLYSNSIESEGLMQSLLKKVKIG